MSAFATLRAFIPKPETQPAERCDMCGTPLPGRHQHLIDPASRRMVCACVACATLFSRGDETKYRKVPRGARFLENFRLTDGQWDNLLIPIGLAFFLKSVHADSLGARAAGADQSAEREFHAIGDGQRVIALYPSPAGPTESMLSLDAWSDIVAENPVLESMESDVEALLVNRLTQPAEYYLAPIDKCYELVGLIRANWHGLSGGAEMWEKIRQFFIELKEDAGA